MDNFFCLFIYCLQRRRGFHRQRSRSSKSSSFFCLGTFERVSLVLPLKPFSSSLILPCLFFRQYRPRSSPLSQFRMPRLTVNQALPLVLSVLRYMLCFIVLLKVWTVVMSFTRVWECPSNHSLTTFCPCLGHLAAPRSFLVAFPPIPPDCLCSSHVVLHVLFLLVMCPFAFFFQFVLCSTRPA